MNMTMKPIATIPAAAVDPLHSSPAPPMGPARRIHPLPIAAAIAASGFFAAIGLLLILSIYGLMLGLPFFMGAVTEMILLGRHRNPRVTHPAWPLAIASGIGVTVGLTLLAIPDWRIVGLVAIGVFGTLGAIAGALWATTTSTTTPTMSDRV